MRRDSVMSFQRGGTNTREAFYHHLVTKFVVVAMAIKIKIQHFIRWAIPLNDGTPPPRKLIAPLGVFRAHFNDVYGVKSLRINWS